jgi:hypothetical protein
MWICSCWLDRVVVAPDGRATVQPAASQATRTKPIALEPTPEPAIPAILAAFDRYEVVAIPEAHGMKDLDDFILSLIRDPAFPVKVNDIEVECGNSLYQPVLDPLHRWRRCAFHRSPQSVEKYHAVYVWLLWLL